MSTESKPIKLSVRNSRDENVKCIERALFKNPDYQSMRRTVQKMAGIDIMNESEFPVASGRFDWKKAYAKFREADSASTFVQVLRAGVNTIVNQMYQSVETTFEDWVQVVNTDKFEELFAPLHGVTFPREVGRQQKYPEIRADGLDIKLRVRKFGSMYPIEMELEDYDQTGQFPQTGARLLGEYLKLVAEVYVYGKLASVSGAQYADLTIPTSETKPSDEATYPWADALIGGGATKLNPYVAFNQANIQAADIKLMNQLNKLGLKMSAKGSRLLVGPRYKFDASVLLNSAFYPTAQTTGTGTFQSINPIQGLYNLTVSRFMFDNSGSVNANSSAWYLIDDTKPWFILLMREAAMVQQEAQNAGESFERDIIRFKGRTRINADFIDPRFAIQGNDGSV